MELVCLPLFTSWGASSWYTCICQNWVQYIPPLSLSSRESFSKNKPYETSSKQAIYITHAVMVYLTKDTQNFYANKWEGFGQMLHMLDPRYHLPSRRHFIDPKLLPEVRGKALMMLSTLLLPLVCGQMQQIIHTWISLYTSLINSGNSVSLV